MIAILRAFADVHARLRCASFMLCRIHFLFFLIDTSLEADYTRAAMNPEVQNCRICGSKIPKERLEVIPDTEVCVRCSKKIGGEFELKVTVGGTHKPGSLKITGQEVTIQRQPKRVL